MLILQRLGYIACEYNVTLVDLSNLCIIFFIPISYVYFLIIKIVFQFKLSPNFINEDNVLAILFWAYFTKQYPIGVPIGVPLYCGIWAGKDFLSIFNISFINSYSNMYMLRYIQCEISIQPGLSLVVYLLPFSQECLPG